MMPAATPPPRPPNEARVRAALWFAANGFKVFSCWSTTSQGRCRCPRGRQCGSPGKHPITPNGFHDATSDPRAIETMLSAPSMPNWGLVCPDGVFVLDVDGDGIARLADLEARYGALPPTLRTRTAHGFHVFLRWPDGLPRPIGQVFGYVTRWGSGAAAGYVIGPRSVHASGFVYEPVPGTTDIATLPEAWAHEVVGRAEDQADITITGGGYELPESVGEGDRYRAILSYVASRYMRGISKDETWAGVVTVLAPRFRVALSEDELRHRFDRAWRNTPQRLGDPVGGFDVRDAVPVGASPIPPPPGWPEPPRAEAFHGVLGDIVRAVEDHTEADPVAVLGSLLAMTGACIGRWRTMYQGTTQGTNLFVVLVGDSSTARKGTAGSIARDVLDLAFPQWASLIVAGLGSGEGLVTRFRPTDANAVPDHRAIVMASEFGQVLTVMGREGSTLSPVMRDAWDGVPMGRALAREQSIVTWHHVSVLGHITAVELHQRLTSTDAANGFGNRFLWLAARRHRLIPFPRAPRHLVMPHVDRLRLAIEAAWSPGEMAWSPAAAGRWEALYLGMASRQRHGLSGALLARAEPMVARLALLYALLDRSGTVDVPHLEAAEAVWEYAERSVLHVFGDTTGDRTADALLALLSEGPIGWVDAKRAIGVRHGAELDESVGMLRGRGLVDVTLMRRTGGGRPQRVIHLPGDDPAKGAKDAKGVRTRAGKKEDPDA